MGFLLRRTLFLIGVGLVAMVLALNSSARHREMSYGLVVLKQSMSNSGGSYSLHEFDFQTLKVRLITEQINSTVLSLQVAPNQKWLAFVDLDKYGNEQIYVTSRNLQPHQITHASSAELESWSYNSHAIFYTADYLSIWRVQRDGKQNVRLTPDIWTVFLGITPNDKSLIYIIHNETEQDFMLIHTNLNDKHTQTLAKETFGTDMLNGIRNEWIYYYGEDIAIYRVSLDGTHNQQLVPPNEETSRLILTSNGRVGVLQIGTHWYIAGEDASTIFDLTTQYDATGFHSFSADEQWIIFTSNTGTYRCRFDGTQFQQIAHGKIDKLIWHPDGQTVFFTLGNGLFRLNWNTLNVEVIHFWVTPPSLSQISPDGRWLLIYDSARALYRIRTDGHSLQPLPDAIPQGWLLTPEYPYHSLRWLALGLLLMGGMPMLSGVAKGLRWVRRVIG
jgi:Tol biopolymer transport system component